MTYTNILRVVKAQLLECEPNQRLSWSCKFEKPLSEQADVQIKWVEITIQYEGIDEVMTKEDIRRTKICGRKKKYK